MYRLSKNFRFESAHRLAKGYEGKCKNMHGHSWNGTLEVEVEEQDDKGFAVDFKDLGAITKYFEETLDHKTLLYAGDEDWVKLCRDTDSAFVQFNENPTCETIARYLYNVAQDMLQGLPHVRVRSVTIHETCTTACTYYENL